MSTKSRSTKKETLPPAVNLTEEKRYQPGPNFKAISTCASLDEESIHDGKKEIWLIQLPRQVHLQGLQDVNLEIDDSKPNKYVSSGTLGRLGTTKDGVNYSLVQECGAFSDQLFIAAGKGLIPVTKRITVEREIEAPAVKRPLEEEEDDFDGEPAEPELESTGKKQKKSEKREKKSEKKEKKSEKKKKDKKKEEDNTES